MTIYTPYFYIIQEVSTGVYYAGSKYGKDANPEFFMKEGGYKTSSDIINFLIEQNGLSSFKIRKIKTFNTKEDAQRYETRFLRRVNARNHPRFYNGHNNDGFMCLEKLQYIMNILHGVDNIFQSDWFKEHRKLKLEEKYGNSCYNNREKAFETLINRYGTTNSFKASNSNFYNDRAEIWKQKYGVSHPAKTEEKRIWAKNDRKSKSNRPIVNQIRILCKKHKIKLGKGWYQKIDSELESIYNHLLSL